MTHLECFERVGVLTMTGHLFDGPVKVCELILQLALSVGYNGDQDILDIRSHARAALCDKITPERAIEFIRSIAKRRISEAVEKASQD